MEDAEPAAPFVGNVGGMIISIPSIGASATPIKPVEKQGSFDHTQSDETAGTASLEDSEEELLQQVKATIGKRLSAVFEWDARNDLFLNRLSALSQSTNNSPNGLSYEKLCIGDDDDFDVVSKASGLDPDLATHQELIEAVEELNEYLKETEHELTSEKRKRRLREKNLIKLAEELGIRGKIIDGQHETMSKLKDELRSKKAAIALLQTELKNERFLNKENKLDSKKDYERSVEEAQVVYARSIEEHDTRISDISKTHAKQCEELCREVIEANREAARLRRELRKLNSGANADGGLDDSQTSKVNLVLKMMITVVVIALTVYVAQSASGESPVGMRSGSAGAPELDMINDQLFVRPTIPKPTIPKLIDARQSVEAAASPTSSLPVEPREVSIEAVLAHRPQSTETWIRRRAQGFAKIFSLDDRSNLLKGLSMTPDLPENALLTLIKKID